MEIQIEYLEKEKIKPCKSCLSPEEYFNPIENGGTFENDGIPKYNHACEYLDIPLSRLLWTKLSVSGTNGDREIITHFFIDGEVWMAHRKDVDGYEEIIHSTQINSEACHIIRTHKDENGNWTLNYNGVIYDMNDGSQKEVRYDIS